MMPAWGVVYIGMGILLVVAAALLRLLVKIPRIHPGRWKPTFAALVIACGLLPFAVGTLPSSTLPRPAAQVWSGTHRETGESYSRVVPRIATPPSATLPGWSVPSNLSSWLTLFLGMGFIVGTTRLAWHRRRLQHFLDDQFVIRRVGKVRVCVSEQAAVAFSARLRGKAYIVLPSVTLTDSRRRRLITAHEAVHHRGHDPQWAAGMEVLKTFFFWNPAPYWLARTLEEIQEFACDAFLIDRRKVASREYGRCLLDAAQSALNARAFPAGTTGMATSASGHFLKRRIQMLIHSSARTGKGPVFALTLGTLALLCGVAVATRGAVQTRTITQEVAVEAAKKGSVGSVIPLEVTAPVLKWLNHFAGTVEGRKRAKEGLTRMAQYKELIDKKTSEYGLPPELIAVPLFESGFKNDSISPPPYLGAGIWQFIPQTARRYGLKAVDEREKMNAQNDERFHPEKETDAAMRYLKDLHKMFGDWRLAIKAYNEGESRVAKLIKQHGTRDPWALEKNNSKESYLSGAIAMMILYKNPSMLD